MLPQGNVRGGTVLTVVEEDNPIIVSVCVSTCNRRTRNIHGIGVHGGTDQELVILEVGDNLLGEALSTLLELLDLILAGAVGSHGLLDLLHVGCNVLSVLSATIRCWGLRRTLEVTEVCLLVKVGLLELEGVDNVDLGLLLVVGLLITTLGGSVGASVEGLTTNGDLGAVGLEGNAVDLLEVVRVGDELVTGDDVLCKSNQPDVRAQTQSAPPSVAQCRGECRDSRCRSACWRYLWGERNECKGVG